MKNFEIFKIIIKNKTMNRYKKVHLYINGNYIGIMCNPLKYNIGILNSYISKNYYRYNPVILRDNNNNVITDGILEKMIYNGVCKINAYYA